MGYYCSRLQGCLIPHIFKMHYVICVFEIVHWPQKIFHLFSNIFEVKKKKKDQRVKMKIKRIVKENLNARMQAKCLTTSHWQRLLNILIYDSEMDQTSFLMPVQWH